MTIPAEWFATDIDLRRNQLLNGRAHNSGTPPVSPAKGQLWYDTVAEQLKWWNGTAWMTGQSWYGTVLDDGAATAQRGRLNFRSSASVDAAVLDEATSDQSTVSLAARYGPVTPSVSPGGQASDGTAPTLARSDHSHGAPNASGADSVLTSWWEADKQQWDQLVPPATFVSDFPGQTVGGGWQIGSPGAIYWTGSPIPLAMQGVYRNSARLSAIGGEALATMGWLCYDADHTLLGQVMCANRVPVQAATETGILLSRNQMLNPSGEDVAGYGGANGWGSFGLFGGGTIASVSQSTEQSYSRGHSVKATWPNLGAGNTESNALALSAVLPANTPCTLGAQVYVPSGGPDVALEAAFLGRSAPVSVKDLWTYAELKFSTGGSATGVYAGMATLAPAAGKVAYLDEVLLRVGQAPLPGARTYFDGSTPSGADASYVWDGAADASTSAWYTLEPNWQVVTGYLAVGDGVEPPVGQEAGVEQAVNPLLGTVYFRPFVRCESGQLVVDSHEVSRGSRDLTILDGLYTGWLESDGQVTAPVVETSEVTPPDTVPPTFLRVGPLVDPPTDDHDAISKAYVDRLLGLTDADPGVVSVQPPQFLWSGDTGIEPQPADLGYAFSAWPLFSLWADAGVQQARTTLAVSVYSGTGYVNCPSRGSYAQVPGTYMLVFTPPADGVILAVSVGSAMAEAADWLEMRCGGYSDVDDDGAGGTVAGQTSVQALSGPGTGGSPRLGYCVLNAVVATGGTKYKFCTEYTHAGPSAQVSRDRTFVLYLPGGVRQA